MRFAKNMCPSQGTKDIFVEPVRPQPQIVICGASPVAVAIADLTRRSGFAITVCAPTEEQATFAEADRRIEGYALPVDEAGQRYVLLSTQGGATRPRCWRHSPSTPIMSPSSAAAARLRS